MGLLIFYVCLALGVSFLCSIMEAVLLSISMSFVAQQEQERARKQWQIRAQRSGLITAGEHSADHGRSPGLQSDENNAPAVPKTRPTP